MHFDLASMAVNPKAQRALILLTNVHEQKTELRVLDLSKDQYSVVATRTLNASIKQAWQKDKYWYLLQKESNAWTSLVNVIQLDIDTLLDVNSTVWPVEIFDYTSALSPCGNFFAAGPLKSEVVAIFSTENLQMLGSLPTMDSYYPNGLCFSADSENLGFVSFDQGGGQIVLGKKLGNAFELNTTCGQQQIRDDYQMSAAIAFDGNNAIVASCYCGSSFEVVKYDASGAAQWELKFDDAIVGDFGDEEEYSNRIQNNDKRACAVENIFYLGGNSNVYAINMHSGVLIKTISVPTLAHIHRVIAIKENKKLLCLDVFGDYMQLDIES